MGCTVTSVSMTCLNWLPSTAGETAFAAGDLAQAGHKRYSAGDSVKFWWFDGRDLSDAGVFPTATYDKVKSETVTLVFS